MEDWGVSMQVWVWALLGVSLCAATTAAWLLHRSGRLKERLSAARKELAAARGSDPLTGLPDRGAFDAALEEAAAACDRAAAAAAGTATGSATGTAAAASTAAHGSLALLVLGLDGLRPVNDAYGHATGDAVLRECARRLRAVGRSATAAWGGVWRLSGDEFAVLAPPEQAAELAAALLAAFKAPFESEGLPLAIGASIGIALYPEHGARARLLTQASLAMRSVKELGGGGHAFYDPAMGVDQRQRAELLQDLKRAVERGQLELVYQPKIDGRSLQVTAAEALLRWQHPKRGAVSPAVFIPLAERHGLIVPIGRWVVEQACRQAAAWREKGLRMRVAVNVSGLQMREPQFVPHLLGELSRHGIAPARFTCEVTETVAMEDTEQTAAAFQRLRDAGLHVSIDDFGTGHSSLASLRRLPAAELKIDRAFVSDLDHARAAEAEQAQHIVGAIVQLARTLRLHVVAEGVETEAQRDALLALGVDELQGYLFAKPMSATALALWASGDDGAHPGTSGFRPSLFTETEPDVLDTPGRR